MCKYHYEHKQTTTHLEECNYLQVSTGNSKILDNLKPAINFYLISLMLIIIISTNLIDIPIPNIVIIYIHIIDNNDYHPYNFDGFLSPRLTILMMFKQISDLCDHDIFVYTLLMDYFVGCLAFSPF